MGAQPPAPRAASLRSVERHAPEPVHERCDEASEGAAPGSLDASCTNTPTLRLALSRVVAARRGTWTRSLTSMLSPVLAGYQPLSLERVLGAWVRIRQWRDRSGHRCAVRRFSECRSHAGSQPRPSMSGPDVGPRGPGGSQAAPRGAGVDAAANLRRLWQMTCNVHSPSAPVSPRSRRRPAACLTFIWPKAGSTMALRLA